MSGETHLDEVVRAVLELPLHRSLGLRLAVDGDPAGGLEMPVDERTVNPSGVLHGGLVPLLLDVTAYLALLPRLEPGQGAVTISTTTSLLSAVPTGAVVRSSATVDRTGRRTAFLTARVEHGDRLVATGQVVKALAHG